MKIGTLEVNGNVFLAPMAGITDTAFRKVVQQFGVSAVWTEMMNAEGLIKNRHAFRTMDLDGHVVPTVFQIYGRDPDVIAEAARVAVDQGAAAVDINMGCPARKIVFKGSGAALMQNVSLASRIVRSVRRAAPVALTVKIRSGWSEQDQNAPEFARAMEAEGADAVIVHSRSRSMRHSGPASMDILREVKNAVRIPVIGNGGISGIHDALDMMKRSGCEGVMVGRGALGRPWVPGRILKALAKEVVGRGTDNIVVGGHSHALPLSTGSARNSTGRSPDAETSGLVFKRLELRRRISAAGVSGGRTGRSDAACGEMVWPRDGSGVNMVPSARKGPKAKEGYRCEFSGR